MQHLKIGILQFNQAWENKSLNYKNIRKLIDTEVEIDLLLLPEMFHTGFSMNIDHAESMENSNGIKFLKALSCELNCAIYTSLIIKEKGDIYNRGVFIEPNEKTHLYDKRKTFGLAGEDKVYSSGKGRTIIDYKGWKVTLQICYDLRFPELCANRLGKDNQPEFDVILYLFTNEFYFPLQRSLHGERGFLIVAYALLQRMALGLEVVLSNLQTSNLAYATKNGNFWQLAYQQGNRVIESTYIVLRNQDFPVENLSILVRNTVPLNVACMSSHAISDIRDWVILHDSMTMTNFLVQLFNTYKNHTVH